MTVTIRERLLRFVDQSDECWLWRGQIADNGYGRIKVAARPLFAHRVAYECFIGPIPAGLTVDHVCHNEDSTCAGGVRCVHRRCINPDHLRAIAWLENFRAGRRGNAAFKAQRQLLIHGGVR